MKMQKIVLFQIKKGLNFANWNVPHKLDTYIFNNLLLLEREALILVFRVPQSVQKVKTAKFHKPKGIMEQKK